MLDASDNRRLDDFENSDLGNHLALSGWSSQLGTSPPYAPESSNLSIASRRSTYSKRRWRGQILPVDVAGVVVVVAVEAKFAIFAPDSPAIIELLPDCLQLLRIFILTARDQMDGVLQEPDIDLVHCLAMFINKYDCATLMRNYGEIPSFAVDSPAIIEFLPDRLQLLRIFIRAAHEQMDGVPREPDIDLVHCLAIFINKYDCATLRNYGEIPSFACFQSLDGRFVAVTTRRLRLPTFYQYSTTWLIIAYTRTPP